MHVCDFPLGFLGDGVRRCDVVGEEEGVAGLFEDRGLDYYMGGVGGDELVDCFGEKLL